MGGALRGGEHHIIQQQFRSEFVVARDQNHGIGVIRAGKPVGLVVLIIIPAREDTGVTHDLILAVGGHEIILVVEHQRAVRPQPVQADGK